MRRLLLIPIIHDEADMGSLGVALARRSAALSGESRWALHQRTVGRFWASIEAFLLSLDPKQMKLYQDGLAAGGEMGKRIVQEAARRGSRNYQTVLKLLSQGAEIRKTEDAQLLLDERRRMLSLLQQDSSQEGQPKTPSRTAPADQLLEQRDQFIARAIGETLMAGEMGVLFIGAHHNVQPHLPVDITVVAVKGRRQVSDYLSELFQGRDDARLQELAGYLASPVDVRA
ncbi:MAG: hypothetical protein Q7K03_05110 [Dehalococcoidia bacterium]|nr:hypothetical protein [Dehalococcoidia bacterium]